MTATKQHPYHLVDLSPWPILTSFATLLVAVGGVMVMHEHPLGSMIGWPGVALLLYCMYSWWHDVIQEGRRDKAHTREVQHGMRIGMTLLLVSETMFFGAFFASFFWSWLNPLEVFQDGSPWPVSEGVWPPKEIVPLDPWGLPWFKTLVLLLSGTAVNWAQHALGENNVRDTANGLLAAALLGMTFVGLQGIEYEHAQFALTDGIYPAVFYVTTGFHGTHVLIGALFLFVCYLRARNGHFKLGNGHLGFQFAVWYWNFVDIVWIFLFIFMYLLGS